jgi:CubicO group peptidase (beta-lactamase class C family)
VDDLTTAYSSLMEERVYGPAGMANARIADDPRPFSDDYATGNALDLVYGTAPQPYAPVGAYAPAGGTLATHTDMSNYVMTQLNRGVAADGTRVVSEETLAQCWTSNVDVPIQAEANPDLERSGYGMGWLDFAYRGGHRFISHAGGIDGFTTFIAVLPDDDLGLIINTNVGPDARGLSFIQYVSTLLLNMRFGLNQGITDFVIDQYQQARQGLDDLAARAGPVDEAAIAPYLGHYQKGWHLAIDEDGSLRLRLSSRAISLMTMPDGSYVMASGLGVGIPVTFARDVSGIPFMQIADLETVRWLTGN